MAVKSKILQELRHSREQLLPLLAKIPGERWNTRPHAETPGEQRWSPAEIASHLVLAANQFLGGGRKVISLGCRARRLGPLRRVVTAPVALVRYRLIKTKAPATVVPTGGEKNQLLAELAQSWQAVDEFIEARSEKELRSLAMRHPLFGWTPMGKMFRMMAAHERRHSTQLREYLERGLLHA